MGQGIDHISKGGRGACRSIDPSIHAEHPAAYASTEEAPPKQLPTTALASYRLRVSAANLALTLFLARFFCRSHSN